MGNQYTFKDWLKNTPVPATMLSGDEQSDKKIPFHYALSDHSYAGLLQKKGLISDKEFQRISDEQQKVYNLLKESRLAAAKARLQEDEDKCRITIEYLQKKQKKLLNQLKELSRYHEMRPTRHIIEHANTQRDSSLLVDPDLYRLILKDHDEGNPLKTALVEQEGAEPPEIYMNEAEIIKFQEDLKARCYPLPEEIAPDLKPAYQVLVAGQREALMFDLGYNEISYELQEVSTLLRNPKKDKVKTVDGRRSRRGSNKKAEKFQMPDEFYDEAKKLYQENPKESLSQDGTGNTSGELVKQLMGKYKAIYYEKGVKMQSSPSAKTIERRLNENLDRWKIDK